MRSDLRAGALGVCLLATAGCTKHQAFVVLTLISADQPITNVGEVVVGVSGAGSTTPQTLTYPGKSSTIGTSSANPVTLSVSFSSDHIGEINLAVEVQDPARCRVAAGEKSAVVRSEDITSATVALSATTRVCPDDGGAPDGEEVASFPGCDPAMAASCGAGKTCFVNCTAGEGMCVPAGPAGPGQACDDNTACVQGTQCFDYSTTEVQCNVKVCLKFCAHDADCMSATGVGLGPGSVCMGPVDCGNKPTGHHTCTFACDPRGDGKTGCPAGLACFLVGEHDQIDCRCPPPTSVKKEGDDCVVFQDCSPGLICTTMGAMPRKCRRICKPGSASDCAMGATCTMLTNDTLYGICL